jgi:hypothetical protein
VRIFPAGGYKQNVGFPTSSCSAPRGDVKDVLTARQELDPTSFTVLNVLAMRLRSMPCAPHPTLGGPDSGARWLVS